MTVTRLSVFPLAGALLFPRMHLPLHIFEPRYRAMISDALARDRRIGMPGGKQIVRVHGPFVSDEEVQAVADFWRAQGAPDYITAVTEEPEDGGFALEGSPDGDDSPEDQLYRRATQLVAESQKASTSWLQRQLRVGYNSAARLVERMEKDGLVSRPDHVGRREVLMDTDGRPL